MRNISQPNKTLSSRSSSSSSSSNRETLYDSDGNEVEFETIVPPESLVAAYSANPKEKSKPISKSNKARANKTKTSISNDGSVSVKQTSTDGKFDDVFINTRKKGLLGRREWWVVF